jgi:epoxyqueuosine reductase
MLDDPSQLSRTVLEMCREHGFAAAGVCSAAPSTRGESLRAWLAAGQHGDMDYLADEVETRIDFASWLAGTRSVIVVADQYSVRGDVQGPHAGTGRMARYAQGRDYHKVIKDRLHAISDALRERHPGSKFAAFVDTAPIPERELAARAGLGWIGKHTLLIHPRLGSYLLLGGILTTLDLAPAGNPPPEPDHCGSCTRCIDACPTRAITPYAVDARRCISYLTIERRSPVEPEWWTTMGDWVYGCDVCQEVCPHNSVRPAWVDVGVVREAYRPQRRGFDLVEMLRWDEGDRRRAFARTAMWRATLSMMKRNALVAAANAVRNGGTPALRASIEDVAWNAREPEEVRAFAREILHSLPRRA